MSLPRYPWIGVLLMVGLLASCGVTGDPNDNSANGNEPAENRPSENSGGDANDNATGGDNANDNGSGGDPANLPPSIVIAEAQIEAAPEGEYVVFLILQPTEQPPDESRPYDSDSDVEVFVLLDVNDDPDDDDLDDIDFVGTALLDFIAIDMGGFAANTISASVNPRQLFDAPTFPLFIRVSITDGVNRPVHVYASVRIEG